MIEIDKNKIKEYNRSINEADWWCRDDLFDACFASYYYYDDELEQICSVFRGLAKNHAFSNANKRTAAAVLSIFLLQNGYEMKDTDLTELTEAVVNNEFEIPEIADMVSKLIYPTA